MIDLEGTQPRETRREVAIQEDQDGDLGLQQSKLIYVMRPTLKRSLNMKPTTTVTFYFVSVSSRVVRYVSHTYVSPLSLSAVSSHDMYDYSLLGSLY